MAAQIDGGLTEDLLDPFRLADEFVTRGKERGNGARDVGGGIDVPLSST